MENRYLAGNYDPRPVGALTGIYHRFEQGMNFVDRNIIFLFFLSFVCVCVFFPLFHLRTMHAKERRSSSTIRRLKIVDSKC